MIILSLSVRIVERQLLYFTIIKMTDTLEMDVDIQREDQNINNLLDDFDWFLDHLDEEYQKWNYVMEDNGERYVYYHNISDSHYPTEQSALEHLFDHIRMVESEELKEIQWLPF